MPGLDSSRVVKSQLQNHRKVKGSLLPEGSGEVSGNWGLLDQVAALTWVQTHIGVFGGDPRRVAVAADRGGADLAGIHLLTTGAGDARLFRRALLMVSDPSASPAAGAAGEGSFPLEASGCLCSVLSVVSPCTREPGRRLPSAVHSHSRADVPGGAFCLLGCPPRVEWSEPSRASVIHRQR